MFNIPENEERYIQREVIIHNFSWEDVNPDIAVSFTSNSYCMFHHNVHSPSGRFYKDEDRDIVVFHCFSEHRTFTTFDYVERILVNNQRQYRNVWDFLEQNMEPKALKEAVTLVKNNVDLLEESKRDQKIKYITNTYNEFDDVIEFINHLYLEK